jgi:hypothetical protein
MERRQETRLPTEVAVRIFGMDADGESFRQTVIARSLSSNGALLTGLARELRCGDSIAVRRDGQQARFKVVWVRDGQAAIQKLKDELCLWKELLEAHTTAAAE